MAQLLIYPQFQTGDGSGTLTTTSVALAESNPLVFTIDLTFASGKLVSDTYLFNTFTGPTGTPLSSILPRNFSINSITPAASSYYSPIGTSASGNVPVLVFSINNTLNTVIENNTPTGTIYVDTPTGVLTGKNGTASLFGLTLNRSDFFASTFGLQMQARLDTPLSSGHTSVLHMIPLALLLDYSTTGSLYKTTSVSKMGGGFRKF